MSALRLESSLRWVESSVEEKAKHVYEFNCYCSIGPDVRAQAERPLATWLGRLAGRPAGLANEESLFLISGV